jgi:hypothetical protein
MMGQETTMTTKTTSKKTTSKKTTSKKTTSKKTAAKKAPIKVVRPRYYGGTLWEVPTKLQVRASEIIAAGCSAEVLWHSPCSLFINTCRADTMQSRGKGNVPRSLRKYIGDNPWTISSNLADDRVSLWSGRGTLSVHDGTLGGYKSIEILDDVDVPPTQTQRPAHLREKAAQ